MSIFEQSFIADIVCFGYAVNCTSITRNIVAIITKLGVLKVPVSTGGHTETACIWYKILGFASDAKKCVIVEASLAVGIVTR
jgi:hypothetical protein